MALNMIQCSFVGDGFYAMAGVNCGIFDFLEISVDFSNGPVTRNHQLVHERHYPLSV